MQRGTTIGIVAAGAIAAAGVWALQSNDPTSGSSPERTAPATSSETQAGSPSPAVDASQQPAATQGASAGTSGGLAPSFRDARLPVQSDAQSADESASPAGTRPLAAFSDKRPLVASPPGAPTGASSTPSFRDARVVVSQPSLRDDRPIVPGFRDTRPFVEGATPEKPLASGPAQTAALTPLGFSSPRSDRGDCNAPEVRGEALDGGRMRLMASAECRANQSVHISYGGAELVRAFDAAGNLDVVLDCFAGAGSVVEVRLTDGTRKQLPVTAKDLDKVSKVAVIWRAPINLDLHVFEYAARFGQPGHVWANATSTLEEAQGRARADRRGHGFLSSTDGEHSVGDKIEVYTLLHEEAQTSGAIGLALDYATRGDVPTGATCGSGDLAEIDFQVVILPRGGKAARQGGVLTRAECGVRLAPEARFNQAMLPGLRLRK